MNFIENNCNGNGKCLKQCKCICKKTKVNTLFDFCKCDHQNHQGYCPTHCCNLIKCRNYDKCNIKLPQWIIDCHKGVCDNCFVQMGIHDYLELKEECNICFEIKNMLKLQCGHNICNDCWFDITYTSDDIYVLCPFCRSKN